MERLYFVQTEHDSSVTSAAMFSTHFLESPVWFIVSEKTLDVAEEVERLCSLSTGRDFPRNA